MDSVEQPRTLAVIIPVLNDPLALTDLAKRLLQQSSPPNEVIVVSGNKNHEIAHIADDNGFRLVETHTCRGLQLDVGVDASTSELLWFLHADSVPEKNAIEEIRSSIGKGDGGGCFTFRFQGQRGTVQKIIEFLVRLRIRFGGMAYGDQALFCTRAAYQSSGGFPHEPLFEEIGLVRFMQRTGRFRALETPVLVSQRRWLRDGWIRRSLHNRWLAFCHRLGVPARKLASHYRAIEEPQG